jgi:hypothetical protein
LAASQHGVVTRAQLLRAGVTLAELEHRLGTGALLPIHRGVYRVGHRVPSVERRCPIPGGRPGLRRGRAAQRPRRRASLRAAEGIGPAAGGDHTHHAPRARRQDAPIAAARRRNDVARDPRHDRRTDPHRPRKRPPPRCPGPRLSRGRGPPPHHTRARRSGARTTTQHTRREKAPQHPSRRHPRHPEQARETIPSTAAPGRARAPTNEPPRRRPSRGLPLATTRSHRRARQLPAPHLAPLLGTGSPPRARGPRPRRRVAPLHLRRCLRVPGADAHGAARSAASGLASAGSGSSASDHSLTVAVRPRTSNSPTSTRSSGRTLRRLWVESAT